MENIDEIMGKKDVVSLMACPRMMTGIDELAHVRFQPIGQDLCDNIV